MSPKLINKRKMQNFELVFLFNGLIYRYFYPTKISLIAVLITQFDTSNSVNGPLALLFFTGLKEWFLEIIIIVEENFSIFHEFPEGK
jgi:hypothetical protein